MIASCLNNDRTSRLLVEDVENLLFLSKSNQDLNLAITAIKNM